MISISELFIGNAYAEGAAAPQGGGFMEFLPLIALLAVFYFLILRPQQKRATAHLRQRLGPWRQLPSVEREGRHPVGYPGGVGTGQ